MLQSATSKLEPCHKCVAYPSSSMVLQDYNAALPSMQPCLITCQAPQGPFGGLNATNSSPTAGIMLWHCECGLPRDIQVLTLTPTLLIGTNILLSAVPVPIREGSTRRQTLSTNPCGDTLGNAPRSQVGVCRSNCYMLRPPTQVAGKCTLRSANVSTPTCMQALHNKHHRATILVLPR